MTPIDLNMKFGGPVEISRNDEHYPSFHYEGTESLDLPEEGVMTIRFCKTASSVSEADDRPTRYSCTVEVKEILKVKAEDEEAPTKKYGKDAEDALDELMKKHMEEKSETEDY